MTYDRFFMISCLMGDELYKTGQTESERLDIKVLEDRFRRLSSQPIDEFYLSGLPLIIRRNAMLKPY
ncbi:hypothetical protein [Larkinella soli]|uniref:hypothetical protein n=1 Tax=Larkinella soli TaxID=1770527 RepID=UPI000FFCB49F|nr:hypothetical protein [Larkinella soli]